ncbi:MAG: hypothetical protein H6755_05190 [Candidatus Omnitrophica bacterium]|nr:hypothetical protein [Candidatus Omnitrophota bacterium]MCB9747786.1 hypothetical protein [Candidatus Omnitrophota bacterium]
MKNNRVITNRYVVWGLLILMAVIFSSCTPLRKKFIREKKKESEEKDLPILDPITYDPPSVSAKKQYSYHYSLWKVWSREFEQTLIKNESGKRQQYLIEQLIMHMEEMKAWLVEDQKVQLLAMADQLKTMRQEIKDMIHVHNRVSFKKKVERFNRDFSRKFKPGLMEEYFIN